VLVSASYREQPGPVLLALRGGPNISLGTRVAREIAANETITLFHGADSPRAAPTLGWLMRAIPNVGRTVTAVGDISREIERESVGHQAIVLGATFHHTESLASSAGSLIRTLHERSSVPMVIVRAHVPEETAFHVPRLVTPRRESLSTRVDRWFAENTFHSQEFADLNALLALKEKQGLTISIGLPALNEEETVGQVVNTLKSALMDAIPLVDEFVLIDSNSTDRTVE